jgi:hypothetical protein
MFVSHMHLVKEEEDERAFVYVQRALTALRWGLGARYEPTFAFLTSLYAFMEDKVQRGVLKMEICHSLAALAGRLLEAPTAASASASVSSAAASSSGGLASALSGGSASGAAATDAHPNGVEHSVSLADEELAHLAAEFEHFQARVCVGSDSCGPMQYMNSRRPIANTSKYASNEKI